MSPTSVGSRIRITIGPPWRHPGRNVRGAIPETTGHSTPFCDRIAFPRSFSAPMAALRLEARLQPRPSGAERGVRCRLARRAPVPALASRGEAARADRDAVGAARMNEEDPSPDRRRGSRGVRKPGRWGAVARAGARTWRTQDRPDRSRSVGSTQEARIQLRSASVVARERSRGCGGGKVGPEIARMLMIRSCVSRLAVGNPYDGRETPGNAAVSQGVDANDGRPRGALVRGEKNRAPRRVGTKGSSDAARQEEQRQQASKRIGATALVTHRQPHTEKRVLTRLYGVRPDPSNTLVSAPALPVSGATARCPLRGQ